MGGGQRGGWRDRDIGSDLWREWLDGRLGFANHIGGHHSLDDRQHRRRDTRDGQRPHDHADDGHARYPQRQNSRRQQYDHHQRHRWSDDPVQRRWHSRLRDRQALFLRADDVAGIQLGHFRQHRFRPRRLQRLADDYDADNHSAQHHGRYGDRIDRSIDPLHDFQRFDFCDLGSVDGRPDAVHHYGR